MVAEEIAPFLTGLFNRFMSAGHFPVAFKEAFITPAFKKPGLDVTNVQPYRPISNLPVVSKLLERIVARPTRQLNSYLTSSNLLRPLSPVFHPVIQPKLLFFRYSRTYWWQLTAGMLLLWS